MKKMFQRIQFAWKGIVTAVSGQANLKIHLAISFLVITTGVYFNISPGEWIAVFVAIGLVLSAELFNTSIESLVDLVSPESNPLAGKVKDMAAGAVLVAAITAIAVGFFVFGKYFLALINN